MHTAAVLVYDDAEGTWARAGGLSPLEELISLVEGVAGRPQRAGHVLRPQWAGVCAPAG